MLREKARERVGCTVNEEYISLTSNDDKEHVNFFKEVEDGTAEYKKTNKEYEKEKKEEQEKYEKQIGYLTYLGQDTNESLKKQSWYELVPDRSNINGEVNMKSKIREDPLNVMKKFTEKPVDSKTTVSTVNLELHLNKLRKRKEKKKKHKKHKEKKRDSKKRKRQSDDSEDQEEQTRRKQKLEVLRAERMKREADERLKAQMLIDKLKGKTENKETPVSNIRRKYNSQFNPELAKQNYEKSF